MIGKLVKMSKAEILKGSETDLRISDESFGELCFNGDLNYDKP